MKQLGILAKYWEPGGVKTRLAESIGAGPSSMLYRGFVETLLRRFEGVADQRTLCYWPPHRREAFARMAGPAWELAAQSSGDLGSRMQHYFESTLAAGAASAVLIGSDSPTLPRAYLEQAFTALERRQVVLGPTVDGGYYLVGVSGSVPPIFADIAWSSSQVWQQTVEHLRRTGTRFAELPPWYDVDQVDDLARLTQELNGLRGPEWRLLAEAVSQRPPGAANRQRDR